MFCIQRKESSQPTMCVLSGNRHCCRVFQMSLLVSLSSTSKIPSSSIRLNRRHTPLQLTSFWMNSPFNKMSEHLHRYVSTAHHSTDKKSGACTEHLDKHTIETTHSASSRSPGLFISCSTGSDRDFWTRLSVRRVSGAALTALWSQTAGWTGRGSRGEAAPRAPSRSWRR